VTRLPSRSPSAAVRAPKSILIRAGRRGSFTASGNNGAALANAAAASQASIALKVTPTNGSTTPATNADFALTFGTQPQAVWVTQQAAGSITVQIRDGAGTAMGTNTNTVTLTLIGPDTLTAAAGLLTAPSPTTSNGLATFNAPVINCNNNVGIGTTYRILATAVDANGASLASAVSQCFDVVANNPTVLAFVQQPSNVALPTNASPNNILPRTMAPPVIVEFLDSQNNTYTSTQQAVTLTQTTGTGTSGSLSGIGNITPQSGFAQYGNISVVGAPSSAYQLTPTSASGGANGTQITGINSNNFAGQ